MNFNSESEVVVLVMSYRDVLSEYEKISLSQCLKVLGKYPIRIVKPQSVDVSLWDVDVSQADTDSFDDEYFVNVGTYSRLLLSVKFYKTYERYKYILIYQLDAFVFRDELSAWCNKGFDYIGAPWFEGFSSTNREAAFVHGGNGGFSLRNVSAHLRVLNSFSYINPPAENWKFRIQQRPSGKPILNEAAGFLLDLTIRNNTFWALNSFRGFEDQFWCLVAARNFSWFKIPDAAVAMNFAYEMQPDRVYKLNNERIPFGCHAWWKYDLEFWRPHIEAFGYKLKESVITHQA